MKAPVRLGVELLAAGPTRLHLGSFFESWIALPAGALKRSLGRDEYHLQVTIGTGHRLAATGRTYICQIDAEETGLGLNQARAAVLIPAEIPPDTPLFLGLRSNLFLELDQLTSGAHFRLLREGVPPILFTLDDHRVEPEQVAMGRYLIDLSDLLRSPAGGQRQ